MSCYDIENAVDFVTPKSQGFMTISLKPSLSIEFITKELLDTACISDLGTFYYFLMVKTIWIEYKKLKQTYTVAVYENHKKNTEAEERNTRLEL